MSVWHCILLCLGSFLTVIPSSLSAADGEKAGGFKWMAKPLAKMPSPSDFFLATRARAALWQDKELAPLSLQVSVRDGVASLFGPVPSEPMKTRAVEVVRGIDGVKDVRDLMRVRVGAVAPTKSSRPPISVDRDESPPEPQPFRPRQKEVIATAGTLTALPRDGDATEAKVMQWKPRDPQSNSVQPPLKESGKDLPRPAASQWRPATVRPQNSKQTHAGGVRLNEPVPEPLPHGVKLLAPEGS